jgi:hypothetical protein
MIGAQTIFFLVMAEHSRSKNGVLKNTYAPAIHAFNHPTHVR